jgi:hypothetical protein
MHRDWSQCFIQVEAAVLHPHESHAQARRELHEVILRLVELEAGRRSA